MGSSGGKRIFMTGASGHIGSAITEIAIAEGYQVTGLCRSEKSGIKLRGLGANPVTGDLKSLDILRDESAKADIVIHLADSFTDHFDPSKYDEVIRTDNAVVDAFGESLKGTDKPLVTTSGTLLALPDPNGGETTEESPDDPKPAIPRIQSEQHALSLADKGVRVMNIRLAPYVYGRGGSGIYMFLSMAFQNKQAVYVDEGDFHTSTVHVEDAARMYLLAAKYGKAGQNYNCTSSTTITSKQIAKAFGTSLNIPAVSLTEEEAVAKLGPFLPKFLTAKNRASSAKAKKELGWQPRGPGLLEEIETGSYRPVADAMLKGNA